MGKVIHFFDKHWKIKLWLFVCTFTIYFLHFHHIFLHLNSLLSSITSDTVKNYFTYMYHIQHDKDMLHFEGMAYPYGEHVVYTDCQPLLTFFLRLLPFTHPYLIGILHGLIYLSFIISPLILYSTFIRFNTDRFTAFFAALAIALLSPQFLKINAGHFGLAYGAMIPFSLYLLSWYMQAKQNKVLVYMMIYQTALFLIHPYMGFSISLFHVMAFSFYYLIHKNYKTSLPKLIVEVCLNLLPIVLFKVFMVLSDHHPNRTTEPFGLNGMVENIDSILAPVFGPFKGLMETMFHNRSMHYEGHSYIGFFSLLMSIGFLVLMVFAFKKIQWNAFALSILFSAFILLLVSFGLHQKLMSALGLDVAFMNQFRATCRFAWFFYYALPLFLVIHIQPNIKNVTRLKLGLVFPLLFFTINMVEANGMFSMDKQVFWHFRNIFSNKQLSTEEQKYLQIISQKKVQAIVPLPLYHSGTEMYDRIGFNNSMIPSMIYACQTGIPIYSAMMSRTSITETENGLNLLNSYLSHKPAADKLKGGEFFVIRTEKELMPDEARLFNCVNQIGSNDSLTYGFISQSKFLSRKITAPLVVLANKNYTNADSSNLVYITNQNREPYTIGHMEKFSSLYILDSNLVQGGNYVMSLKYHYTLKNYHALACDIIVTETDGSKFSWKYMVPMRILSGFYKGYAVFETKLQLDKNKKYEFLISGREAQIYHVSDFMLRPEDMNVLVKVSASDSTFNNFPTR